MQTIYNQKLKNVVPSFQGTIYIISYIFKINTKYFKIFY